MSCTGHADLVKFCPLLNIESFPSRSVGNRLRSSFYPASLTAAGRYFPAVSTST